jgi:GT2 family glycosyltransferase
VNSESAALRPSAAQRLAQALEPYHALRRAVKRAFGALFWRNRLPNPAPPPLAPGDYAAMASTIRDLERRRLEAVAPRALPKMLTCPPQETQAFTADLALPDPRALPKVSIVIPVYNGPTYVLECLAALAAHTAGVDYEVIAIDDASEEETAALLRSIGNIRLLRNDRNLGFLLTCNRCLEIAKGRFLVFLNSDAQVQPGWLGAMLAAFETEKRVGAVGPKLVYPNGRLQEAGALINRDCTATLVGLTDDPARLRYNRRREVEYCSGACLLVETQVFRELGGFDPHYAPAYCEDADLCLRLRQRGLRIIYEPAAVVAHHLSAISNSISASYKRDLAIRNQQKLSERWQAEIDRLNEVRLIALYLPQFHPIPENDVWWGKGFTEWSNVAKAKPNFVGHVQPNLPADLGFYDLRMAEVMDAQAELARRYGIHGFCYYYYWFAGKRLLEGPLERLLETGRPDFPFCIAWANENWTKHWDGRDREILVGQDHSPEDDVAVIRDMIRYLRHPNYIRVGGRPLLVVYRPALFPNPRWTSRVWREECRNEGLGEIYLAMVDAFNQTRDLRPSDIGFDAAIEFPPHRVPAQIKPPGRRLSRRFQGSNHDYRTMVSAYVEVELPDYPYFRSVMPRWDNTPRQQDQAMIFHHATPGAYQAWLESAIRTCRETLFGDERLVFINAWNEWAEGAYLEPDRHHGHQFLEATKNSLDAWLMKGAGP